MRKIFFVTFLYICISFSLVKLFIYNLSLNQLISTKNSKTVTTIWNDHFDYNEYCKSLHSHMENKKHTVQYVYIYGGFGNQLYTFISSIILALSTGRNFHFVFKDYKKIFSTCLYNYIDISRNDSFINCEPYINCYKHNLSNIAIDNSNIRISGILMNPLLGNSTYNQKFKFSGIEDYSMFLSYLTKLVLLPRNDLSKEIEEERKTLFSRPYTIGLQIRMNGKPPRNKYTGIGIENITKLIADVDIYIRELGYTPYQTTLYISTDTPSIIGVIKENAMNYHVVESNLYIHGHTSSSFSDNKPYINVTKKVISDFLNIVYSDSAFVSWKSSLGRMMCIAMYPKPCYPIFGIK